MSIAAKFLENGFLYPAFSIYYSTTMKRLLLLRHAESSGAEAGRSDFDRPLNERGRREAAETGRLLGRERIRPDLILCSPARRARETATFAIEAAGLASELRFDARIYEARTSTLLEIVSQLEEGTAEVMLVGHNPGMSDLLARLTGEERYLPTASLARISLDVERWSGMREQTWRLEWLAGSEGLD